MCRGQGVNFMIAAGRQPSRWSFPWFLVSFTFFLLAAVGIAPHAAAQSTGGRIRGTITDPTGAAVAATKVQLVNESTHATHAVRSNESGEYVFIGV